MHSALLLLIRLHIKAFFRRMVAKAKGVKGLVMTVVGGVLLVLWLGSMLVPMMLGSKSVGLKDPTPVVQTVPVILLAVSLLSLLSSTGGKGITFTAAETDFLFPGPFSRRQLILYRVMRTGLASLFGALFFGMGMRRFSVSWAGSYFVAVLLLLYLQIFSITATLLMQTISERIALSRVRWLLLAGGAGIVMAALYLAPVPTLPTTNPNSVNEMFAPVLRFRDSAITQTLATPFKPFAYAMTAPTWAALLVWSVVSAGVVVVTLLIAMWLDADYLESSVKTSVALQEKMNHARRGKVVFSTGTARVRLPEIPRLGGAGSIFWRQGTTAVRSLKGILIIFFTVGLGMAPFLILKGMKDPTGPVIGLLTMFTFMGGTLFQFDFRGDVDRIDTLKALPISPLAITLGQLLTPVAMITAFQLLLLAGLAGFRPEKISLSLVAMAFAPLVTFVFAAVENTSFLLFPHRASTTPGDLTAMARNALLLLSKFLFLGLGVGLSLGSGILVHWLTKSKPIAYSAAWVVAACITVATLPLVVWAFNRYDVSADTSPNS